MSDTEPVKVTTVCDHCHGDGKERRFVPIPSQPCLDCGGDGTQLREITGRDALVYAVGVASAAASRAWREVGYSAFLVANWPHDAALTALRAFDEKEGTG